MSIVIGCYNKTWGREAYMRQATRWTMTFLAAVTLLSGTPEAATAAPEIRIEPLTVTFAPQEQRPIFVEIDWMEDGSHSHKPSQAVIDRIVQTFAAAGYSITIDVSNAIAHQTRCRSSIRWKYSPPSRRS